jgi:hypothetical protein
MNKTNKTIILLLGLVLALVSIVCEIMLFMDYAQTTFDKTLAGITAGALVGCQFGFVGFAVNAWRTKRPGVALVLFAVITVLFFISVSGTASFFESRFSGEQETALKNSSEYENQLALVVGYQAQAKALRDAAKAANDKGNSWNAGQLLNKSQEATRMAQQQNEKLTQMQPLAKTSGAALAAFSGQGRWAFWFAIAALVDMCPLICFAIAVTPQRRNDLKVNAVSKKETPAKPITEKTKNKKEEILEKVAQVKRRISQGEFGKTPGVRQVMRETGIKSNPLIKAAFNELETANIVRQCPETKTYSLLKTA